MVRFTSIVVVLFGLVSVASASFTPTRISYKDLVTSTANHDAILTALRGSGMLTVTGIPSFRKLETLALLPKCMEEYPAAAKHTFSDGTVRRSLATHSFRDEMHGFQFDALNVSCESFEEASLAFRKRVQAVTDAFASLLQDVVNLHDARPLLKSVQQGKEYRDIPSVCTQGEHLEHFHSYQGSRYNKDGGATTIDWHTDQGLFLVFTPGLIESQPSDGFYVRLPDGSAEMVAFEEQDDVAILLGDAINQILNPVLQARNEESFHIPPHSLDMPAHQEPRVWYGRMVLPPSDAIHPVHQESFGQMRQQMIESDNEESIRLGCSSSTHARSLNNVECESGSQFYCWHQCFNLTNVTQESCEAQDQDLACANDARQLWNGMDDMEMSPRCVDLQTAIEKPMGEMGNHTGGGHHGGKHTGTPTTAPSASSALGISIATLVLAVMATIKLTL